MLPTGLNAKPSNPPRQVRRYTYAGGTLAKAAANNRTDTSTSRNSRRNVSHRSGAVCDGIRVPGC